MSAPATTPNPPPATETSIEVDVGSDGPDPVRVRRLLSGSVAIEHREWRRSTRMSAEAAVQLAHAVLSAAGHHRVDGEVVDHADASLLLIEARLPSGDAMPPIGSEVAVYVPALTPGGEE